MLIHVTECYQLEKNLNMSRDIIQQSDGFFLYKGILAIVKYLL